jgi:hypothetical protein
MTARPGGTIPKNPDIEYVAGFNRFESCEVKCNLQSTDRSENSIINILKSAKNQLPKGKAGIILLRIPENWIEDEESGREVIGNAARRFLDREKSTRLTSVFVFVSETRLLPEKRMAHIFRIKEFQNQYCDKRSGICLPDLSHGAPNWRLLQKLAERELSRLPQILVSG